MRTIFGKPIRQGTTGEFFPDKLTLKEFCEDIRTHIDPYEKNMENLGMGEKDCFVEGWLEGFAAWMEIEEEPGSENLTLFALKELNNRVHSGYDFNADPDGITKLVGEVLQNK